MTTEFSRVLASIDDASEGRLHVAVPPDWLQGRTVFGGMQMAHRRPRHARRHAGRSRARCRCARCR